MDESKVTRYATEKYVNDSSPINNISSKVLATVPASNIELQKTITINNVSINKDRRYYIEFLGSKKLCSLLVGDGTDDTITCGIGKYVIKVSNKSTNISLSINKINTDDTTTDTFTDLIIYEEEVKYLDSKYLETDLVLQNSISLGRVGDIGMGSSAIGFSVEASSESSHAEGYSTTASGYYSHAENFGVTASGNGSHAEGVNTTSSGDGSHAEGYSTTSSGKRSHAEGYNTISSGVNSHAEGWCTKASGNQSHAEGSSTTASGLSSHAEGDSTTASGESSHAEGYQTKASSQYQHVQGKYNIEDTANKYAHIVGNGTNDTNRSNAHTLDWEGNAWYAGKLTVGKDPTENMDVVTKKYFDTKFAGRKEGTTVGVNSFAVGENVEASGAYSHAEGSYTKSLSDYSHAEGNYSQATNNCSHAEGFTTIASGKYSHAEGNNTTALGESSHSEGSYSKASSDWSHAEGYQTKASSQYQHVQGKYNIEDTANKYAHIVGNGTTNMKRSNAHTLDWEGNAWYSGKLTVGKDPTDDMDVVTKKYFDANKGSGGTTVDTSNFVKKETGKGLSTNDLTNALKSNYDAAYTHSQAAHAPSTAQKNSDITKAEIEAKLTGDVTSHTHSQYLTEHQSLNGYATKNNPVFTGSVSLGRKEGTTVGENSFTTGEDVEASGYSSHAEGWSSKASGYSSHAEGWSSKASGDYGPHAEGYNTTASGSYGPHAEGNNTTASGNYGSHAEGTNTTASGESSHAEGNNTKASSQYQHVQGKYNIEDTANKYAHIVGNGTADTARSNAHTLDWQGNAWYAGKLSQEGTPTEDKDLVTKKYVDNKFENINLGPYSIQYNNENNRLEFIYTPPATE